MGGIDHMSDVRDTSLVVSDRHDLGLGDGNMAVIEKPVTVTIEKRPTKNQRKKVGTKAKKKTEELLSL
jgi:uncharacterized protein YxjI